MFKIGTKENPYKYPKYKCNSEEIKTGDFLKIGSQVFKITKTR